MVNSILIGIVASGAISLIILFISLYLYPNKYLLIAKIAIKKEDEFHIDRVLVANIGNKEIRNHDMAENITISEDTISNEIVKCDYLNKISVEKNRIIFKYLNPKDYFIFDLKYKQNREIKINRNHVIGGNINITHKSTEKFRPYSESFLSFIIVTPLIYLITFSSIYIPIFIYTYFYDNENLKKWSNNSEIDFLFLNEWILLFITTIFTLIGSIFFFRIWRRKMGKDFSLYKTPIEAINEFNIKP